MTPPTKEPRRWTFREGGCALPAPCLPCIDGKEHEPVEIVEVVEASAYDALAAKLAQAERERGEAREEVRRLRETLHEMRDKSTDAAAIRARGLAERPPVR